MLAYVIYTSGSTGRTQGGSDQTPQFGECAVRDVRESWVFAAATSCWQ